MEQLIHLKEQLTNDIIRIMNEKPPIVKESGAHIEDEMVQEFIGALVGHGLCFPADVKEVDGDYKIENDSFSFSFRIEDEDKVFAILNIEAYKKGTHIGTDIIDTVHEFASDLDLEVQARKVKDGAEPFWENMGYSQDSEVTDLFYLS